MKSILFPMALAVLLGSSGPAAGAGSAPVEGQKPASVVPLGSGTEYATVEAGATAPDFAYETLAGGTARLRDLRGQGHVLLVFGADETELRRLELESTRLTRLGIVPVAVLDWRVGACRAVVKRLSLSYPVVPDRQRAIGAQYNVLDPYTRQDSRAWFVVDRLGRVRALDRFELPRDSWVNIASSSLGLPAEDASRPASQQDE